VRSERMGHSWLQFWSARFVLPLVVNCSVVTPEFGRWADQQRPSVINTARGASAS
jgi:hypothetical protein